MGQIDRRTTVSTAVPRWAVIALVLTMAVSIFAVGAATNPTAADASHFRSTQLTWEVVEVNADGSVEVEFTSTVSGRRDYSNWGNYDVGETMSPVTRLYFGDGNSQASPPHQVILVNDAANWMLLEGTVRHTYASAGTFTAYWDQCCRLALRDGHINNGNTLGSSNGLNNRIEAQLDLSGANSSPISLISPVVDCPIDAVCQFQVPAVDAEGFDIRWRFAAHDEAAPSGFVQPGAPDAPNDATVDPGTGTYVWDTNGATTAADAGAAAGTPTYYSTQVVMEKRDGAGAVVATTAVDFFIRLGDTDGNRPPAFTEPTPADGATFRVALGSEISFPVAAADPDEADTVTLGLLGAPAGHTFDHDAGNPATGTFAWTPTSTASRLLTLIATDDLGLGAVPRSITLVAALVASIELSPHDATATIGEAHTVTATVTDDAGRALSGAEVVFEVTDGPHAGGSGTATTTAEGQATFTYEGSSAGTDAIAARYTPLEGDDLTSATVTVAWSEPADADDDVDDVLDEAVEQDDDPAEQDPDGAADEPIEVLDEAAAAEAVTAEPTYTG